MKERNKIEIRLPARVWAHTEGAAQVTGMPVEKFIVEVLRRYGNRACWEIADERTEMELNNLAGGEVETKSAMNRA